METEIEIEIEIEIGIGIGIGIERERLCALQEYIPWFLHMILSLF